MSETKSNNECNICCNIYNKSKWAKTNCPSCNFETCKACVRYYLTNSIKNAHCMNCKKDFDRNFMVENLNGSFVNKTYKTHRANILLDREKARLPEAMPMVQRRVEAQDLEKTNIELIQSIAVIREKYRELYETKIKNEAKIRTILNGGGEEKKQHFHRACPQEDCKGFLSTAWKCGLCKIWACSKCFEVKGYNKDETHTCSEENLKTAAMLKKETKNCPGCASTIYKISGCDQIWCTQCKIAFSWKTGEIERGVIHNPHFYQWQRDAGKNIKNPQEVPCGGIPEFYIFKNKVNAAYRNNNISKEQREWVMNFHRGCLHWQHWEIRLLRRQCRGLDNTLEERINYLMNKISEEELKAKLVSKEKSRNKKLGILHIYELMNTVFTESSIDIYNTCNSENIEKNKERINNLITYSNKELARISYIFSQSVRCFMIEGFKLYSVKYNKTSYNTYINSLN